MRSIVKLFLIIILSVTATGSFAQGWVKEKGKGYLKLAQNVVSSNQY
nr:hypothetical protein [Pseudopedobacter sp.]